MEQTLTFNGQALGDLFLRVEPANHLLTPPVRRMGFLQAFGAVDAASRNLLYARVFYVLVTRATNLACDEAIAAMQHVQGLRGDIRVMTGMTQDLLCEDWVIDAIDQPQLASGFGGRVALELAVRAVGETPPLYGA